MPGLELARDGGREYETSSAQAVGRRRPRHRRVCGHAGGDSGVGGWYDSPGRKQCEQRVFVRSEFASVTLLE